MKYKIINILIGTACDMDCPYCLQRGRESFANRSGNLEEFASGLAKHLNGDQPIRISFWGGEPMLYMKKIRQIVKSFDDYGISPSERYTITTNGQKMDEAYVEFANSRSLHTIVSSHNWNFTTTHYDRFFELNKFSFAVIISRLYLNFMDLRPRFYELLDKYGREPTFFLHFLRATEGCGHEFYMRKDDVDELARHLLCDLLPMAAEGDRWAIRQCSNLVIGRNNVLRNRNPGDAMCIRPDALTVDVHGNIYDCHHDFGTENVRNNLFKPYIPIRTNRTSPFIYSNSAECQRCECWGECHGGCYLSKTHEIDCYLAKTMSPVYKEMERVLAGGELN